MLVPGQSDHISGNVDFAIAIKDTDTALLTTNQVTRTLAASTNLHGSGGIKPNSIPQIEQSSVTRNRESKLVTGDG